MKRIMQWVMAATLVCGLAAVGYGFSSCEKANAQEGLPLAVQHPDIPLE